MAKQDIFVIFIEDEEALHKNFLKEVEIFNAHDDEIYIHAKTASSIQEAKNTLSNLRFDVIVTDLKIEEGQPDQDAVTSGNAFIRELKGISPCPICVLTGKPTDVDNESIEKTSMAIFSKEADAEEKIFSWIKSRIPLIQLMRESFGLLNQELAPLFHGGVASRVFTDESSIPADSALRVILENVADSILTVNSTRKCHPQESYIFPVLRKRIMTGDIIKHDGKTWAVLTPACNIVRCDASAPILLAECTNHDKYQAYLTSARAGQQQSLLNLINQNNNHNKHFLPPLEKGSNPFIVDFQLLRTVIYSELKSENIIAAVAPRFLPNLVHRFSAFIGRPGAPDIDPDHCVTHSTK